MVSSAIIKSGDCTQLMHLCELLPRNRRGASLWSTTFRIPRIVAFTWLSYRTEPILRSAPCRQGTPSGWINIWSLRNGPLTPGFNIGIDIFTLCYESMVSSPRVNLVVLISRVGVRRRGKNEKCKKLSGTRCGDRSEDWPRPSASVFEMGLQRFTSSISNERSSSGSVMASQALAFV